MATIKLGNRDLGELDIQAISTTWEEYPTLKSDKLRTDKKLYLELDKDNFNLLMNFYGSVVNGDNAEGLVSKVSTYYKLMFVKHLGEIISTEVFESRYGKIDEHINDNISEYYSYIVCVN